MQYTVFMLALIMTVIQPATYAAQRATAQSESTVFGGHEYDSSDSELVAYIRTALENNPGLRASFDEWQAALETIPQARALPDPMLQWTHFIDSVQTRTGPQNNRFVVSQRIPWPSKRNYAGLIAQDEAEQLWWKVGERKLEVIRQVKQVYAEYTYLAHNKRIVQEGLTLLRNLEPIVQVRVRNGASQGDLLRLQVEVAKVENELRSLERLRPALERQFRAILHQPQVSSLPWPSPEQSTVDLYDSDELFEQLDANNPVLKQLNWKVIQSDHRGGQRALWKKPNMTVGLTYIDTGEASGAVKPSDSGNDPFGITVGISIPIYRKKYDARVQEARHSESSFHHQLTQKRLNLHAQLEMELYRLEDAAHSITLYRDTLIPRARQASELIQVSYQSGNSTLLDIIDSERDLLLFEQSYWRAQRDYAQAQATLEALCGGTLS